MEAIFNMQASLLQLTKPSSFIARYRRDISACVRNCVDQKFSAAQECKQKVHETVKNIIGDCDKMAYVLDTYHGCRHEYRDVTLKKRVALEQDVDKELIEDSTTKPTNMFDEIQAKIEYAIQVLAKAISKYDHWFACKAILVGSAREDTKIGCCDEFDYNFVLTKLSSICKVCHSPESPPGYVQLKSLTPVYDENLKDLFDQNRILNTRIVKFKFETLAKQILSSAHFCDLTDFEFTDPSLDEELNVPTRNALAKLNAHIKLTFTKPVNEQYVPHSVSIDLVPALHINNWWPDDARRKEFCQTKDCLIVFTQPQTKYPWIGWTEPHGFISFARAESRLIHDCRRVVKAAYMVLKRMSKYFCRYQFFSSYVIKTALLWYLDEKNLLDYYRIPDGCNEVKGDELLCLVQNVLRQLLCFAAQDYVPDFFMPQRHQPVWLDENYLMQYHMRLYQHGLTYKDIFSLSKEQSHDEVLHDIKSTFTYSHVMYWSLLSDNDDLKLFVPSTINPLREISYDDSDK